MRAILIFLILVLAGCQAQEPGDSLVLHGNINLKVNGKFNLKINGQKISGEFINLDNEEIINVSGSLFEQHLRLEEFYKENQLTGIFDGLFQNGEYTGNWISPDQKIKVPFLFYSSIQESSHSIPKSKNINAAYLDWVRSRNGTKDFCSKEQCEEDMKLAGQGSDLKYFCGMMIKEEFPKEETIYSDINNDGILDAFIYAVLEPCMYGTWFINVFNAGYLVVFVSKENGGYQIFENHPLLGDNIGFGRIVKVENGKIFANGGRISGEMGVHGIDYTWAAQFYFVNNNFELISKSEEEKVEY